MSVSRSQPWDIPQLSFALMDETHVVTVVLENCPVCFNIAYLWAIVTEGERGFQVRCSHNHPDVKNRAYNCEWPALPQVPVKKSEDAVAIWKAACILAKQT